MGGPDRDWQPVVVSEGDAEGAPILLSCEHARNALPPGVDRESFVPELIDDHFGWDPGAEQLVEDLADVLGAPTVRANFSRLYIDANRPLDSTALIRNHAEGRPIPANQDLEPSRREQRIDAWRAYHGALGQACETFRWQRGRFLLLSVHTFTPTFRDELRDYGLGILHDEHHADAAEAIRDGLLATGFDCRLNEPYSGMDGFIDSAGRHGRAVDVPYLLLEVRSDLLVGGSFERVRVRRALLSALGPYLSDLCADDSSRPHSPSSA